MIESLTMVFFSADAKVDFGDHPGALLLLLHNGDGDGTPACGKLTSLLPWHAMNRKKDGGKKPWLTEFTLLAPLCQR